MNWKEAQEWERKWHDNCVNSYWEETKQRVYADRMGLVAFHDKGRFPTYDLQGKSILDIGGGPYSLLLKCVNGNQLAVFDPCDYPEWVEDRYSATGIAYEKVKGEDYKESYIYDEVWIYNCLQHTENPEKILKNARQYSKIIRLFEWIDTGISDGHLHDLKEEKLNKWLGGIGKVEVLNESGCMGEAYYGVFLGDAFDLK